MLLAEAEMADKYLSNDAWKKRIEQLFDVADVNKDGYLEAADLELWVDNIARATNAKPVLVDKLRQCMREYCTAVGLTPGKRSTREQYIRDFAAFANAERLKKERGEELSSHKLNNAWYDVVDTNRDKTVTLDEYRTVMGACNFPESAADAMFKLIDKDNDKKISRSEIREYEFKVYFGLDD